MKSTALPSWIERLAGLAPRPLPPEVFWLTATELRFARFERGRKGQGLILAELQSVGIPSRAFAEGPLGGRLSMPEAVTQALASLLERVARPVREGSLVLPDTWVRQLLLEFESLPPREPGRSDAIRFRLKKIVPYRLEDLRIGKRRLPRLPGSRGEPWLIGLASEPLLSELERIFRDSGVRLGQILGAGAAAAVALLAPAGEREAGVLWVEPEGMSFVLAREGVPVLWRQKLFSPELASQDLGELLLQELRLTRTHLAERFGSANLAWVGLLAPAEVVPFWQAVLESGLGAPVRHVQFVDLGLEGNLYGISAVGMTPLVGAALEVAVA